MRTLRRGDEWYAIRGNQQSLWGAHRAGMLSGFSKTNGRTCRRWIFPTWLMMPSGRTVISAHNLSAQRRTREATADQRRRGHLFYVLRHRAVDGGGGRRHAGAAVYPTPIADGHGRYDVIVTVPEGGRYEVRATAQDGSGHASMFLGAGEQHLAKIFPSRRSTVWTGCWRGWMILSQQPGIRGPRPYARLRRGNRRCQRCPRARAGAAPPGDMQRYVWSFNGKTVKEESTIRHAARCYGCGLSTTR